MVWRACVSSGYYSKKRGDPGGDATSVLAQSVKEENEEDDFVAAVTSDVQSNTSFPANQNSVDTKQVTAREDEPMETASLPFGTHGNSR